jgi:cytochrome c oxidase subunit 3
MSSAAVTVADLQEEHPPIVVPSSGMPWNKMGMLFFIGSEIALFGSFFMAYFFIRVTHYANFSSWHEEFGHLIPVGVALINTVILLSSSVTIHFAESALKKNNRKTMIWLIAATLVLGLTFLGLQINEYRALVTDEHIGPSSNAFSSVFFSLTGLHGSHVLVGAIMLAVMLVRALRGHYSSEGHLGFNIMSIYWHFVDVVWIFVVSLIYLPGNLNQL